LDGAAIPERLKAAILRLLEKDPAKRFPNADEFQTELSAIEASLAPARPGRLSKTAMVLLATAGGCVVAFGGWLWQRASRSKWAREVGGREIGRSGAAEDFTKAADLARQARAVLPQDPALEKLWTQATMEFSIDTEPAGADVFYRPYRGKSPAWESLAKTPLPKIRLPKNFYYCPIRHPRF